MDNSCELGSSFVQQLRSDRTSHPYPKRREIAKTTVNRRSKPCRLNGVPDVAWETGEKVAHSYDEHARRKNCSTASASLSSQRVL